MRGVFRTVRFRITILASAVVALVLGAVGVTLLVVQQHQLHESLDESLQRRADELVATDLAVRGPVIVLPSAAGDEVVIQIASVDHGVVAGTENAVGIEPIASAPSGAGDEFTTVASLPVEDDDYRILSRRATIGGVDAVVHVAENTDDLEELLGRQRIAVAAIIPIAVAVLAGLVWWLVGRTLRPVEDIRAEVAGLGPEQLDRRVSTPRTGDEIDRLAETMNLMLDRLEDATRRQQRFVADASHELRSPLARIRAELETAGTGGGVDAATANSVLDEIDELTALVDDLLVLARSDAREVAPERRLVDLDDLVFEEVQAVRETASGITIDVSGVSAAAVLGAPGELRRMVRNLLDNGARYASSRIVTTLSEDAVDGDGGWATMTITDDGPGVPPDQAAAIFERFTRLDDARARSRGGTGLGLAIAHDIAERHGGSLRLDASHRSGARFVARLPAAVTRS